MSHTRGGDPRSAAREATSEVSAPWKEDRIVVARCGDKRWASCAFDLAKQPLRTLKHHIRKG